ncbi:MAG: acyltransferase family protein [Arenicella sp.]
MNSSKLSYRAEIDGLRAIAVVSVILYHAQMVLFGRDWFEGGFIGVDIFFVISGYLITRIILSELQTKGSFSFLYFYERRARRILPMLFVVIFVSIPYAWQKLLPSDFVEYAESILASLFFGSNFFFYFSTTEYGADSALLKPFLHTWSLGVEEQFYLVFPIIAIIAFKFFRQHFLTILVGLSLLSIYFAELMEVRNSDLNFYLPFSRFWELAIGSILAYRELNYKASNEGIGTRILAMFGLYLVAYSILFFDSKMPHPSFYTLIPILGVALIIGFASKDELVGKMLGSRPFVWVGLISYSVYLWHFPIFAFSRMGKEPNNFDKFEWIAITLGLSIVSCYLVEKPFRNRKIINLRVFNVVVISSLLLVAGGAVGVIKNGGFVDRLPPILQSDLSEKPWLFNKTKDGKFCYGWYEKNQFCTFGSNEAEKNLYVIGDSNMESISSALITTFEPKGYRITTMNSSACYFIPNSFSGANGKPRKIENEPCDDKFQALRLSELGKTANNLVIIGGMLDVYLKQDGLGFESSNNNTIQNNFIDNVRALTSKGTKVVLVYPYPRAKKDIGKFAFDKLSNLSVVNLPTLSEHINQMITETSYQSSEFLSYSKPAFELLDSIKLDNVIRVYPHRLFCEEGLCQFLNDRVLYVVDRNHPSSSLASKFAEMIKAEVEKKGW